MNKFPLLGVAALAFAVALAVQMLPASAQDKVVAKVNGKTLTEADLRFAEAEIGSELNQLPEDTKRRVLVEYLIENQLFADAADGQRLGQGSLFEERMAYWKRRALRDSFFDKNVKDAVPEAEAKRIYDQQVGQQPGEEQVRARHILVESEQKAREIFEKIAHGDDFAKLAKEHSKDPGSKERGGDLGYFGKGMMVPQFEEAAFKIAKGEVSQPIQTQFGWHIIKVDDRRKSEPPTFDSVKAQILASLVHRKAQEVAGSLRKSAKIEYVDEAVKRQIEEEEKQKAGGGAKLPRLPQ